MNTSLANPAIEAWKDHLTREDHLIATLRNQNLIAIGTAIANHIGQIRIVDEIVKQGDRQNYTARLGAESIIESARISTAAITKHIHQLGMLLDSRLSGIEDQLRVGVLLTKNIAALMRIPDFQKERQYFIEQGLKHYHNARLDPSLYALALENLLKAEERDRADYVVLHRIGMIYLYAPTEVDVAKAETYFLRAAKFAMVESDDTAVRVSSILAGSDDSDLLDGMPPATVAGELAAESYYQCSIAAMLQGRGQDAQDLALKACSLTPGNLQPQLQLVKAMIFAGNDEEAGRRMYDLLVKFPVVAYVLREDSSLLSNPHVQSALARRSREVGESDVANAVATYKDILDSGVRQRSQARESLAEFMQAGKRLSELHGVEKYQAARRLLALADRPDKRLFASANECFLTLARDTAEFNVTISTDGSRVCAFSSQNALKQWVAVWDTETGRRVYARQLFTLGDVIARLSPDGGKLAIGVHKNVEVIDLAATPQARVIQAEPGELLECLMHRGELHLLCSDGDVSNGAMFSMFNVATGESSTLFFINPSEYISVIAVAPIGGYIAYTIENIKEIVKPSKSVLRILIRSVKDDGDAKQHTLTSRDGKPFYGYLRYAVFSATGDKLICHFGVGPNQNILVLDVDSGAQTHVPFLPEWTYAPVIDRLGQLAAFHRTSRLCTDTALEFYCYGDLYVSKTPTGDSLQLVWTRPEAMTLIEYARFCRVVLMWAQTLHSDLDAAARDELFQRCPLSKEERNSLLIKAIRELETQQRKLFFRNFDKACEWLELAAKYGDGVAVNYLRSHFPSSKWAMPGAGVVDTSIK